MKLENDRSYLINAMSVGGGGGVAVACAYAIGIKHAVKAAPVSVIIYSNDRWQDEIASRLEGENIDIIHSPQYASSPLLRTLFEWHILAKNVDENTCLVQLNGQAPLFCGKRIKNIATLVQDPSPYVDATFGDTRGRIGAALRRRLQKRALLCSGYVLWTSRYIQKLVTDYHSLDPDLGKVVYNGMSSKVDDSMQNPESPGLNLLTVSNVSRYKGQIDAIKSLGKGVELGLLNPDSLTYSIVGAISSDYSRELIRAVSEAGLDGVVRLYGRVSDEERDHLFRNSNIFIHLSRCESFGIPIIEAMAQGLPVIAANLCALPEVAGEAAMLVDPDNTEEVARAIAELHADQDLQSRMVSAGFTNVAQFNWSDITREIVRYVQ